MWIADEIVGLLVAHGVGQAVVSPGSRNASLLQAVADEPRLRSTVIVDERVAAFYALGMAVRFGRPVALICTSGSAMLNYAPALAEAYYRKVPLIAVTADRPLQWIDQDDSQTIRQPGALDNVVKKAVDLASDAVLTSDGRWMANRLVNDALLTALRPCPGPVHINVRIDPAMQGEGPAHKAPPRVITETEPEATFTRAQAEQMAQQLVEAGPVLVMAGFLQPDHRLNRALARLAALPGVAVMTETTSNLHSPRFLSRIDTLLGACSEADRRRLAPGAVLTVGGALVSRHVKEWLRGCSPREHWHIGRTLTTVDSLRHLTRRVEAPPALFFSCLATAMARLPRPQRDYASEWHTMQADGTRRHDRFIATAPWSDLQLYARLIAIMPPTWDVHFSNGTPIRYAQLMDTSRLRRVECNRGVSGIDGCTSTAIGAAAAASNQPTLLVTGDLSAAYDLGALASGAVPQNFRMLVVNNSGGDIFRFVGATRSLRCREQMLAVSTNRLLARPIALAEGWTYLSARTETQFINAFERLKSASGPTLLEVFTPADVNTKLLTEYFSSLHAMDSHSAV